jgi:hypothetical protein
MSPRRKSAARREPLGRTTREDESPLGVLGDHCPPLASAAEEPGRAIVPAPEAGPRVGLECPRCGCQHFEVVYTRPLWGGRVQRRRECRHCGRRLTTIERAVSRAP